MGDKLRCTVCGEPSASGGSLRGCVHRFGPRDHPFTPPRITFRHTITGYLVGNLWMPCTEAYKPFTYTIPRDETLRDAACNVTNDGDFRGCDIADGMLETVVTIRRGGRYYRRSRMVPLGRFPSIADMVTEDWAGPALEWEE